MSDEKKETSLKDRLASDIEQGSVSVGSRDLADFGQKKDKTGEATTGTQATEVPDEATQDRLLNAVGDTVSDAVKEEIAASGDILNGQTIAAPEDDSILPETVDITESERNAFLDAIVAGDRYQQPFELFNGRIKGVFRTRSQNESNAIVEQLQRESRDQTITSVIQYSTKVRGMLLTTQVESVNGDHYPELSKPYFQVVDGTEVTPPGWIKQLTMWEGKDEGVASAVYHELRLFEKKYWTMVIKAKDQNFWNPEESTSE